MAEEAGERTEEATAQRREDFRKRGQVAQSRELGSVLMFFGAAGSAWALGRFFVTQMNQSFGESLGSFIVEGARQGDIFRPLRYAGEKYMIVGLPFVMIFGVLGFAANALQIGFLSKEDALQPNFEHINPVSGMRRLLSLKSLVEGFKALLKLIVVFSVAWILIQHEFLHAPLLVGYSMEQLGSYLASTSTKLFFAVGVFMLIVAVLDYGYQWWELERQMRMTKQEIKEEVKSREGDPQIKARIRRIQREMAQKRMMEQIPKADVIITNPTHIAVALRYDDKFPAPQLIAKGADLIAEKIKSRARELNIPIVENKPLARTIYKTLKIGQVIPRELYNAVAEVLAYVFKLKRKAVRR